MRSTPQNEIGGCAASLWLIAALQAMTSFSERRTRSDIQRAGARAIPLVMTSRVEYGPPEHLEFHARCSPSGTSMKERHNHRIAIHPGWHGSIVCVLLSFLAIHRNKGVPTVRPHGHSAGHQESFGSRIAI